MSWREISELTCVLVLCITLSAHAQCDFNVTTTSSFGTTVQSYLNSELGAGDVTVCLRPEYDYSGCSPISMQTAGGGSVALRGVGTPRPYVNCTIGAASPLLSITNATDATVDNIEVRVPYGLAEVSNANATLALNSVYVHDADVTAIQLSARATVSVDSSVFSSNTAAGDGGCVASLAASSVCVSNSNFSHNTADNGAVFALSGGGELTLVNSSFTKNYARESGGVVNINITAAAVDVRGCAFANNTAAESGGCFNVAADASHVRADNSTFAGSTAGLTGAAIRAVNSTVEFTHSDILHSRGIGGSCSGTLYSHRSYIGLTDCDVKNNTFDAGVGSVLYLERGGAVADLTRTTLAYNTGGGGTGGVIYASNSAALNFTGCSAYRNECPNDGGGIYTRDYTMTHIFNTTFIENTSGGHGGVFHFSYTNETVMIGSLFQHNTAFGRGGIMYLVDSYGPETIDDCVFIENSSSSRGGVAYINYKMQATVSNSLFLRQRGSDGGAIYILVGGYIDIYNCNFTDNSGQDGFAVMAQTVEYVYVRRTGFVGNSGGGSRQGAFNIQSVGTFALFEDCYFERNENPSTNSDVVGLVITQQATVILNNIESRYQYSQYGCTDVWVEHGDYLNVTDLRIFYTTNVYESAACLIADQEAYLDRIVVDNCTSHDLAGLSIDEPGAPSGMYFLSNSMLSRNVARTYQCGALCVYAPLQVDNVTVIDSRAKMDGGGVFLDREALLTVGPGGLFLVNNTAGDSGGGLHCEECAGSVLSNVMVVANTAAVGGGLHFLESATVINSTVVANHARTNGGGIVGGGTSVVGVEGVVVTCNSVEGPNGTAGVLAVDSSNVTLSAESAVVNNYIVNASTGLLADWIVYPDDVLANVGSEGGGRVSGYALSTDEDPRLCFGVLCANANSNPCVNGGSCMDPSVHTDPYGPTSCNCSASPGFDHDSICFPAPCGNGVIDSGEECDDGNRDVGDGCAANCTNECGNGLLDAGEECDDSNRINYDGCDANCTLECGNGRIDGSEECDDNNTVNYDGCDANCTLECGNGFLNSNETCDDGNRVNNDGCDANCTLECGNGRIDGSEECDEGDRLNNDGCDANCTLECGNGVPNTGEECDDTNTDNGDGCDSNCMLECGNGQLDGDEECDDGNTVSGDGCSSSCVAEGTSRKCGKKQWERKGRCVACPYGGYCDGGPNVLPKPGFWAPDSRSPPTECPVYDACPGVVDEDGDPIDPPLQYDSKGRPITSICRDDYTDSVCSKCKSKRLKDGQRCVPCPSDATSTAGGLVFVSALLIVVLAIAVAVLPDKQLDMLVAGILVAQMFVLVGRDATKHIPGAAGRRAAAVYRYFSVITFDVDFMQLGCAREKSLEFADVFWGTIALVVIASALFSLAAVMNVVQRWARGKLGVLSFTRSALYHVVHVNVLLGVAAYVQLSLRVLQGVNCVQVYGKPRLHVELATECYSGSHAALSAAAWILMFAYVIAFPVFVLYIGWQRPAELRASDSSSGGKRLSSSRGSMVFAVSYSGHSSSYSAESSEFERGTGSVSEEEEQQSSSTGNAVGAVSPAVAYRSMYGFLIRNLHKHAYWFQALRLVVVFVIVLDVVVPRNTSFKLLGGAIILVVNVLVVGIVWPFKSRFGNIFQILSGLLTALQTVIFLQEVVDPRLQSVVVFGVTLALVLVVSVVVAANLFRNQSLLFKETSSASDSWVSTSSSVSNSRGSAGSTSSGSERGLGGESVSGFEVGSRSGGGSAVDDSGSESDW